MTKHIEGFVAMAEELVERELSMLAYLGAGLDRVLVTVEKTAKGEFGTYQPTSGSFPAWAELSDETKAQRVAQGFTENDPLLRSGELRDAVEHDREILEGVVGVKSGKDHGAYPDGSGGADLGDMMVWHELGTSKMPARPVLGPAAFRNKERIQRIVGEAAVAGIVGDSVLPAYAFETENS